MVPVFSSGTPTVVVALPASLTSVPVFVNVPVPLTELSPPQPKPEMSWASSVKVPALRSRAPSARSSPPLLPSLVKPVKRRAPSLTSVVPEPETLSWVQPPFVSSVPVAELATVTVPPPAIVAFAVAVSAFVTWS